MAFYLGENVMPHQAHRTWIKGFAVHDDGPNEKMLRTMLAQHTVAETARIEACKKGNTHAYLDEPSPRWCGGSGDQGPSAVRGLRAPRGRRDD